jgi:hypothetical protein
MEFIQGDFKQLSLPPEIHADSPLMHMSPAWRSKLKYYPFVSALCQEPMKSSLFLVNVPQKKFGGKVSHFTVAGMTQTPKTGNDLSKGHSMA